MLKNAGIKHERDYRLHPTAKENVHIIQKRPIPYRLDRGTKRQNVDDDLLRYCTFPQYPSLFRLILITPVTLAIVD